MKKTKNVLLFMLIILLVSVQLVDASAFSVSAGLTTTGDIKDSTGLGTSHGASSGTLDGKAAAELDFEKGLNTDWRRNYPTQDYVAKKYSIKLNNAIYQSDFLMSYKKSYQESYERVFATLNFNKISNVPAGAEGFGSTLGNAAGAAMAARDFARKSVKNWENAYSVYLKEGSLSSRYNILVEGPEYVKQFEIGFRDAFKMSYISNYEQNNFADMQQDTNYTLITRRGGYLTHSSSSKTSVQTAGVSNQSTLNVQAVVPENALIDDSYFGFRMLKNSSILKNTDLRPLSDVYVISLPNDFEQCLLYKPIEFGIEHTGSSKAGIYRWDGYKWLYMPTTFDGSNARTMISTPITTQAYKGGTYALFLDEKFQNPRDVAFNKMRAEILTAYKRGYVPQMYFFNPDSTMTMLEYADVLYNAFAYRTIYTEKPRYIVNSADIKGYEKQVQFALAMGYVTLGADNVFNATAKVSYSDLDNFIKKQIGSDQDFQFMADKMLKNKFYRSDYISKVSKNAKKCEVIYTLIELVK